MTCFALGILACAVFALAFHSVLNAETPAGDKLRALVDACIERIKPTH